MFNQDETANMNSGYLQEQVEIFISCRNLTNMEFFGKSEPKVQLFRQNMTGLWELFAETEMIQNTANPDFAKSFIITYDFEHRQGLKFHIGDVNSNGKFDYIGDAQTCLSQLMGAKNQTSILDIKNLKRGGKSQGKLIVRCETVKQCNEWLYIEAQGINISKLGGCFCFTNSTNPFLIFYRSEAGGGYVKIFESEDYQNTLNPIWRGFELSVQHLSNGNHQRNIKICLHSKNNQTEDYIGEYIFTLDEILLNEKRQFELRSTRTRQPSGTIVFKKAILNIKPTFLDYVRGGIQLKSLLAIDFTGSNGEPHRHDSLHSIRPGHRNQYQKALDGVMDVLIHYDNNQAIAMYGFGAKLRSPTMKSNEAVHCFPCTFNPQFPFAFGIDQMELIYQNCLQHVTLSGPTYFAPLLRETSKLVQESKNQGSLEYSILVIMTDGHINDMQPTIDCLVEFAWLPLSIVIIGIGHADFSEMEKLDGDFTDLRHSNGNISIREIVQFVPFARFKHDHEALARHVLEKIPDQLTAYYRLVNIAPMTPQVMDINSLNISTMPSINDISGANMLSQPSLGFQQQPNILQQSMGGTNQSLLTAQPFNQQGNFNQQQFNQTLGFNQSGFNSQVAGPVIDNQALFNQQQMIAQQFSMNNQQQQQLLQQNNMPIINQQGFNNNNNIYPQQPQQQNFSQQLQQNFSLQAQQNFSQQPQQQNFSVQAQQEQQNFPQQQQNNMEIINQQGFNNNMYPQQQQNLVSQQQQEQQIISQQQQNNMQPINQQGLNNDMYPQQQQNLVSQQQDSLPQQINNYDSNITNANINSSGPSLIPSLQLNKGDNLDNNNNSNN